MPYTKETAETEVQDTKKSHKIGGYRGLIKTILAFSLKLRGHPLSGSPYNLPCNFSLLVY
jgi:hypothetical protein